MIKDTDKEDKEKALKASWEADEPGRAEKAQISRQKFILKKKQKAGETLTEEELAIVHEKRERIKKKDQEDLGATKGGACEWIAMAGREFRVGATGWAACPECREGSGCREVRVVGVHAGGDVPVTDVHFVDLFKLFDGFVGFSEFFQGAT